MGEPYKGIFLELNRLVVNEGLPHNALSFFVSQCLKILPRPLVIVSYADSSMGHHGYIYQATNWLYTGLSKPHIDYKVKGQENKHNRHVGGDTFSLKALQEKYGEENVYAVERPRKYRYFQFLGDKRQKRKMAHDLKYPIIPGYPKGDNVRYDASYETSPNLSLF